MRGRRLETGGRIAALAAFFCLLVFLAPGYARAEEAILRFVSDVTLLTDGSVDVVENITVRAEGRNIQRGIYRDIPTVLVNDDGSKLRSRLEVAEVLRDGAPETHFTEAITNGTRIYIGESGTFLSPGVYRYTIHYTMTRMARRFSGYDELFWNATGNFWDFPIDEAIATINLPPGAEIDDMAAYTGPFGSTQSAATMRQEAPGRAVFRAQNRLAPYEGMSVAVSFGKGVLTEPGTGETVANFLSDRRDQIISIIAVLAVLGYYYFTWNAVGRDPEKGPVFPRFHPPRGFSPALVHYVWAMGWQNGGWQAFTAALVDLAVKGCIAIEQTGKKKTTLAALREVRENLPPGEAIIHAYIRSHGRLTIDSDTGPGLNTTRSSFISALQTENRQVFFRNNTGYTGFGIALSVLMVVIMFLASVLEFEWIVLTLFVSAFLTSIVTALYSLGAGTGVARFFKLFVIGFLVVNILSASGNAFSYFPFPEINSAVLAIATIVAANVVFAFLMRAPTVQGRKVMDEIEGFRMYLETAEKERLNLPGAPQLTVGRFEEILPYAIALGVEKPWTEHFEAELGRHAVPDAAAGYHPGWYRGTGFSAGSLGRDVSALASGMSAAMIAAQPASSSSSGFGGGGSSGGGGGGGGGGGW